MKLQAAYNMAEELMDLHKVPEDWGFGFCTTRRAAGVCRRRFKVIEISRHFVELNNEDEVKDTILHEIAHALCGPGTGHGREWKLKCLAIGARPETHTSAQAVAVPMKYTATCPVCGYSFYRSRPSDGGYHKTCYRLGKAGNGQNQLIWTKTLDKKKKP